MNKKIDIVITSRNGAKTLGKLLESIKAQNLIDYNCFVIDDNSEDNTAKIVKENFGWVKLIEQAKNHGPAHNRNVAAKSGNSEYLIFFDDDTFLSDTDWLNKAVKKMDSDRNIGQLASMIVSGYDDDILLDCGIFEKNLFFEGIFHKKNKKDVLGKHLISRDILGACSASTIIRREVFDKIGGFDGKYFYMSEDLDLSLRVHLSGYKVIYYPALVSHHYESQAMGKNKSLKRYLYCRNSLLAYLENYPIKYVFKKIFVFYVKSISYSIINFFSKKILRIRKNYFFDTTKYFKIFGYLLIHSPNIILKRIKVNKFRKISRDYLPELNKKLTDDIRLELGVKNIIFLVTNKCNARCKMCFLHKDINSNYNILTLEEIRKISDNLSSLENIVISGGEPFLRDDIDEICNIFIKSSNPIITLPTNGSLPDIINDKVKNILSFGCKKLVVSLSLDGDETFHNSNRGIAGLFKKVNESYNKLENLKNIYGERLQIQVNTCISKENLKYIDLMYKYIGENMPGANWVLEPIRGSFNKDTASPLTVEDWHNIYNKIKKIGISDNKIFDSNLEEIYRYSINILNKKERVIPCYGGDEFISIDFFGNIFPCEILSSSVNIRDISYNLSELLSNQGWLDALSKIKRNGCYCTHFCWLSHSIDKFNQSKKKSAVIKAMMKEFINKLNQ